jgi:catechol 2,3-dioxygenase-like lactoylglutathione lyase family enzyme
MPRLLDVYTTVLGMTITDRSPDDRAVFLSARPAEEHHELTLVRSADQKTDAGQISFHVDTLQDLKVLHARVSAAGCQFDRIVNHGIAFGAYFHDPEGNRVEIYWATGIDYPQPFGQPIDLSAPDEELLRLLDELPPREGTGAHLYGRDVGKRITVVPSSYA